MRIVNQLDARKEALRYNSSCKFIEREEKRYTLAKERIKLLLSVSVCRWLGRCETLRSSRKADSLPAETSPSDRSRNAAAPFRRSAHRPPVSEFHSSDQPQKPPWNRVHYSKRTETCRWDEFLFQPHHCAQRIRRAASGWSGSRETLPDSRLQKRSLPKPFHRRRTCSFRLWRTLRGAVRFRASMSPRNSQESARACLSRNRICKSARGRVPNPLHKQNDCAPTVR